MSDIEPHSWLSWLLGGGAGGVLAEFNLLRSNIVSALAEEGKSLP